MNNSPLNTFNPTRATFRVQSPPSKALANYAKVSEQTSVAPLDTVELSGMAKQNNTEMSGMRKTASAVALGIALLGAFGAQGAMATDVGPQMEEVSFEQAGREIREVGIEIGRQGKEVGQGAARVGKTVGKEAAEVGKEIGRQGAKLGKGVGRAAKGFWRGLTGKGSKN